MSTFLTPALSPSPTSTGACRRLRAVVVVSAALLASASLSACQGVPGAAGRTSAPAATAVAVTSPAPVPAGLEGFYGQDVRWYPCGASEGMAEAAKDKAGGYSCARVSVPLDYSDPAGATIEVAVKKRAASKDAVGALFVNPGGPGGSGIDLVGSVDGYFSQSLLDAYDVIGFDPRGVGESTAVDCLTDAELDAQRSGEDEDPVAQETSAAAAEEKVTQYVKGFEAKCEASTSTAGLLDHIDTVSAARDLDVLRALSGDEALTYLGYSYGTYLGATYAGLFPGSVGRMVLDGAIDPTLTSGELTLGQAKGFEDALHSYVKDCQAGKDCPLKGSVDEGVVQVQDFLDSTQTRPVPTSDDARTLTYPLASSAVLGILYQSESWSVLSQGLDQAMNQDDGSTLLYIADLFASRNEDGTYSGNGDEAISAINCLDYPVTGDSASWDAEAEELRKVSPTFGADLVYSDLYCQAWGHESTRKREAIHATGAAPILVVGTTGDPATPYPWAQALAEQLDSGGLLTWKGEGHTAYGRAGDCVNDAVDTYLLTGEMPKEGLTCSGNE